MVQKFKTLADMERLVEFAHFSQVDKAGYPYVKHPQRVLAAVQARGAAPYVQIAALGHDLTEDTAFTCDMLISLGFSEAAVGLIRLLDRGYSRNRYDRLKSWAKNVSEDAWSDDMRLAMTHTADDFYYIEIRNVPEAKMIKEEDMRDNRQPWRTSYLTPETQDRLNAKYDHAEEVLNS